MVRLPPAEKLPLAVRKNLRDNWENKKADLEKSISDVMDEPWTIDIDPNAIWPYGQDWAKDSTGEMLSRYIEGARDRLVDFIRQQGEEGKTELNTVCHAHVIGMDIDEEEKFNYNGCKIADGKLFILFAQSKLGTNIDDPFQPEKLLSAISQAGSSVSLSFEERQSIKKYDEGIGETKTKINEILAREVTLEPGFEAVSAELSKDPKAADRFKEQLGPFVKLYFEAFVSWLQREKFGEDDMLQEGMNDALSTGVIKFRIVDALKPDERYNQSSFEDGILYLETTAERFGVNIDQVCDKLMDLL